ncbi:DUF4132 domain-containing protein [uncultured Selenomonas sp.]|uniref:DUF4132 domain-containing protein n=1 Tax=uncultured Selenomonas sp. TaxID=159275 RepID=UPI0028E43DB9|nr:DUF4132 domain-containing protein [uncultured Selenomonas sp.]
MINWYLGDEDMAALLAELKAAMPTLNEQSQKLLNFLFFRTDKKGEPDYDWDVVVTNFRRNKKDVVCTVDDDVLPPALYPAFDLMMGEALRKDLVAIAHNLADYPYTNRYTRRLVRSHDYHQHVGRIWTLVERLIRQRFSGLTVPQILRGAYDVEKYGSSFLVPEQVAVWIDRGNEEVLSTIREMLLSENNTKILTYDVFRAIFKARNTELVELVGKLLLAGKLQEGLRQAICETMDCGRQEHFVYIMGLIEEHNLIRFSSVRRAIATTIGIGTDSERVDKKLLALIMRVLRDPAEGDAFVHSADNVEAMVGLWSKGLHDVKDLIAAMEEIIGEGRPHSVLLVSYFLHALQDGAAERSVAKRVLLGITDAELSAEDMKKIACYLPFVVDSFYILRELDDFVEKFDPQEYFVDAEEATRFFDLCERARAQMKQNEKEYEGCIFPWYGATLRREDLARTMVLAALCADGALTDRVAPVLSVCHAGQRVAPLLLKAPLSPVQEQALIDLLRLAPETAARIIRENPTVSVPDTEVTDTLRTAPETAKDLMAGDFVTRHEGDIAALLRLKTANVRRTVLDLLYAQPDAQLRTTMAGLLTQRDVMRRLGALDLLLRCKADGRIPQEELLALAQTIKKPTSDEQVLIDELARTGAAAEAEDALFDAAYVPDFTIDLHDTADAAVAAGFDAATNTVHVVNTVTLDDIFPCTDEDLLSIVEKLDALYTAHEDYEYKSRWNGREETTLASGFYERADTERTTGAPDNIKYYPLPEVWEEFYRKEIKDFRVLYQLAIAVLMVKAEDALFTEGLTRITGRDWTAFPAALAAKKLNYFAEGYRGRQKGKNVIRVLHETHTEENRPFVFAAGLLLMRRAYECYDEKLYLVERKGRWSSSTYQITHDNALMQSALHGARLYADDAEFAQSYALRLRLAERIEDVLLRTGREPEGGLTGIIEHAKAHLLGMEKADGFFRMILGMQAEDMDEDARRNQKKVEQNRVRVLERYRSGALPDCNDPECRGAQTEDVLSFINEEGQRVIDSIVTAELRRGDTPALHSAAVDSIERVEGIQLFVRILQALGALKLDRGSWYAGSDEAKASTLSHLLKVSHPHAGETAADLKAALKDAGIAQQRLVEAAMYAPQWIPLIEAYLGWRSMASGCYYFQAHMSDIPKERASMIAKYTPIPIEDLKEGAFDIGWFKAAYKELGKAHFESLYDAAKYISNGAKHARARKFADAVRGELKLADVEKEITAKRNKDLVMCCGLIPLKRAREKDMLARYVFLQNFLKESKQFGAQRRASEEKAVEIALSNLARACGFDDVTRLVWTAETELIKAHADHFTPKEVEDVALSLSVAADGAVSLVCTKGGKPLKAVPAKLKKNAYVLELKDAEKNLKEQYRRAKKMLEEMMEDGTPLLAREIANVMTYNPVIAPLLKPLVFQSGTALGFYADGALVAADGTRTELAEDAEVKIAHALDLYESGTWADYQKYLFEKEIRQPFKQVFRELYIKTADEHGKESSHRYAGHQVQPAKTVALLKTRRWVIDGSEGLQRIYYKANIIARIYALADWYSPADIEAPTLEWVEFFDRKTFQRLPIDDVPDLIFSEVMRDVDLVVSVAHVGGVDPEASHSTVEMRRAIVQFNLPLFKLDNVRLEGAHAHIHGKLGDYTVHLGSGVIQQKAGAMINVLPVHSQHRGRLFLPFLDEDPKTAEILSKIILFAEDGKIKDPFILDQIRVRR